MNKNEIASVSLSSATDKLWGHVLYCFPGASSGALRWELCDVRPMTVSFSAGQRAAPHPEVTSGFMRGLCEPDSRWPCVVLVTIRDWSLVTGRGGGGLQHGKIAGPKLCVPPPLS